MTIKTKAPHPEVMTPCGLVGELIFRPSDSNRKKQLLETIYSQSISQDNLEDWLIALRLCQGSHFFPGQIAAKITEIVDFIESSPYCCGDPLMKKICQSVDLPKKIIEAACFKSKIENHSQPKISSKEVLDIKI